MPNNKRLIIATDKLFVHNAIATEFAKAHDILTFTYNPNMSLSQNTKVVWKNALYHVQQKYESMVFMGTGSNCNLLYSLYEDKNLEFDAGVFVNYKEPKDIINLKLQEQVSKITDIYTFGTSKKNTLPPVAYVKDHQCVNTLFGTTRSKRLALEIYGCVVYGTYHANTLEETNSVFIQFVVTVTFWIHTFFVFKE